MKIIPKRPALFIAALSLITFFILLPSVLKIDHISDFDFFVESHIPSIWSLSFISFFLVVTQIGSISFLLPLSAVLFIFLISKKHFYETSLLALSMFIGALSVFILKEFTQIPRLTSGLVAESSFSFPSGHTTLTTIFFLMLGYLLRHHIKNIRMRLIFEALCVVAIVLVGASRIYLSVHRPSEVVAGFLLGVFCVSISTIICHKIFLTKSVMKK